MKTTPQMVEERNVVIPSELLEIANEYKAQNKRSTHLPLFVVTGNKNCYGDSSWCDHRERKYEDYSQYLCESCRTLDGAEEDLPEDCSDCDSDAFHWYQIEEDVPYLHHGVFLTGKACDDYIERRSYEMPENAHSYAISSYWSDDMGVMLKFLESLTPNTSKGEGKPY